MIEAALGTYLPTVVGLATLIGDRVYPLMIPQAAWTEAGRMPCLVYAMSGAARGRTSCATDELVQGSLQVDCYARKFEAVLELAAAARAALIDFAGPMAGVQVNLITLDNEFQLVDPEPGLYRVSQSYTVWYLEDR